MLENLDVNIAPFLNIVIYVAIFFLLRFVIRKLIKNFYGKRIIKIAKAELLEIFSEHYNKYEFKEAAILHDKIVALDVKIKNRFKLVWSPLDYRRSDMYHDEYGGYRGDIPSYLSIGFNIHKKFWLYRMKIRTDSSEKVEYEDCVKKNRENKIDKIIN